MENFGERVQKLFDNKTTSDVETEALCSKFCAELADEEIAFFVAIRSTLVIERALKLRELDLLPKTVLW